MKKIKYLFPLWIFISVILTACANGGNAPGPNDSADNSLPAKPDTDSIKNSLKDTLYENKDTTNH